MSRVSAVNPLHKFTLARWGYLMSDVRERSSHRRSRSRSHDRHRSSRTEERRSRSPASSRRSKRPTGWDVPPTAESIAHAALIAQAYSQHGDKGANMIGATMSSANFGAMNSERMSMIAGNSAMLNSGSAAGKALRRIYVGNLPPMTMEEHLKVFFSDVMKSACSNIDPGEPVVMVYINHEKKFAFVEFRTIEEAAAAMDLDGINFNGTQFKIRRPSDFNAALMPPLGPNAPRIDMSRIGVVSTQVSDGPNKLFCGGLPYELGEEQIKELLSAFGRLRSFHLVRDAGATLSKGYCFFEYMEDSVVEPAISGLNGIPIGDKTLTVRRAQVVASTYAAPTYAAQQAPVVAVPFQHIPVTTNPFEVPAVLNQSSRVLCLLSMVEADELRDDQDYADIKEDILEECGKFGMVSQLVIPRPDPRGLPVPGLGKVFVEFANAEQCGSAKASLEGRKFANRTVIATFYPEEHFASRALY